MRIFSLCELRHCYALDFRSNVTLVSKSRNEESYKEGLKFKYKGDYQYKQEENDSFTITADGRVW